jgi:hypothetical protein
MRATQLSATFFITGLDDEAYGITPAEEQEREIADLHRALEGIDFRIFDMEQVPDQASAEARLAELKRERKATRAKIRALEVIDGER